MALLGKMLLVAESKHQVVDIRLVWKHLVNHLLYVETVAALQLRTLARFPFLELVPGYSCPGRVQPVQLLPLTTPSH